MISPETASVRQRALANFGGFALRSEDLDEILTEACRLVGEALGTARAKVLEITHEGQALFVRAGIGWDLGVVGKLSLPMSEHSSETFSIKAGQPVVTRDIHKEDRFEVPGFMKHAGVVALVNVPIFLPGGRAYGLLQVDSTEPREFGEEDTEFLRTYATILGPVIDRLHRVHRLRATEERFRLIVEAAHDYAIFVTDADGRIRDWLPGAEAVFGWSAAEVVGQPAGILLTPEDRDKHRDVQEIETARSGDGAPDQRWHVRKDGTRVLIEGAIKALRDKEHGLRGFLKIGQDVTERRRAEERLRESEARQRALVEALPVLVWRAKGRGDWTWSGSQWSAYSGLSAEASCGAGWLEVVHPEDREATLEAWARAEADGLLHIDHRIRHGSSGRYAWFQTRAVPVQDAGGQIVEWVGTSTDIEDQIRAREVLARDRAELEALVDERTAELMAAEETVRQAQKMEAVGQLTGGIAHDFNNMLQTVTGGIEIARRRMADGHEVEAGHYLNAAREAADRAAALTRRLLAFARRQRLEPRPVDADKLIVGIADLIRRTMGPAIQMELRLRDDGGRVLCDPSQLESALLNLCINARDAMPEGGRLVVGTEAVALTPSETRNEEVSPGNYVAVRVEDTGTGIPPEVVERVFEPFFTTKPPGQGTGLGLSQVWGFVRQSGGLVRIESTPGLGTTVSLFLPVHDHREAEDPKAKPPPPRAGVQGTVLLVDDEEAARQMAADWLRELGLAVLEARTASEALNLLASSRPDLLVTDVGLPAGMNGRQLAEAAREQAPELPILFITGYTGTEFPPGFEVISKPFTLDELARRVQAMLLSNGPKKELGRY